MATNDKAFIAFYDDASDTFKHSWLRRSTVQPFLDRAPVDSLPSPAPGAPITDEDARRLGGMAFLFLTARQKNVQKRLEITTVEPLNQTVPAVPVMAPAPLQVSDEASEKFAAHGNFRHWHIDIVAAQGRNLVIGLSLDAARTTIMFETTTRCSIQGFALVNVVDAIAILHDGTTAYDQALVQLSGIPRQHRAMQPNYIVRVSSSVGVNAVIECVGIAIQP